MKNPCLITAALLVIFINSVQVLNSQTIVGKMENSNSENWYMRIGMGYSFFDYPFELSSTVEIINASNDNFHLPLNFNIGIYRQIDEERSLAGIKVDGEIDKYESAKGNLQISTYLLGLSYLYYLSNKIGNGLYMITNAGLAYLDIQSNVMRKVLGEYTLGFSGGFGYSLPISINKASVQLELYYSNKNFTLGNFSSYNFDIGILF